MADELPNQFIGDYFFDLMFAVHNSTKFAHLTIIIFLCD